MGAVYLAFDTRLELQVAIKVISPEFSQTMEGTEFESVLKRFESEAKLAAKIDHPNVIRIYGSNRESVEIDNHQYDIDYLIMELVSGRTLRNTMDVSGFEHEEEIRSWISKYLVPILDGVQKVHDCGIIHRDIKPENFLMKDDVPKLADFGLSMGFNLPPVTGSVADIFGTLTYMAPEQFYNFSMARETADVYAIGKILFEVVEGKISEKSKPFQQVKLSNPETVFLEALNSIIMDATAVNPTQRIGSAKELKEKMMQLLYCSSVNLPPASVTPSRSWVKKAIWPAGAGVLLALGALILYSAPPDQSKNRPVEIHTPEPAQPGSLRYLPFSDSFDPVIRSKDMSTLRLIPPAELENSDGNLLGPGKITIEPFYLSESPITNQQYVDFLNENLSRVKMVDSDVFLEGQLALKISEKIRNYKPVTFEGGRFHVKHPMHSSCAVLLVTAYGAEAYAKYYNLRLPLAQEWLYVMISGGHKDATPIQLPTPVFTYKPDKNGLRGINQLAEWGKTKDDEFITLGQAVPGITEKDLDRGKNPFKYYTDTGFRVAKNAKAL